MVVVLLFEEVDEVLDEADETDLPLSDELEPIVAFTAVQPEGAGTEADAGPAFGGTAVKGVVTACEVPGADMEDLEDCCWLLGRSHSSALTCKSSSPFLLVILLDTGSFPSPLRFEGLKGTVTADSLGIEIAGGLGCLKVSFSEVLVPFCCSLL